MAENNPIYIQNVVSTVNVGCQLNLQDIATRGINVEYNPQRFRALIMRLKEPRTTILVFHSGKLVCTGAKSEELSKKAARRCARKIQKLGYNVVFGEFKIQNIVCSCDLGFRIRLQDMRGDYDPELFPGLTYRMSNGVVVNVFRSGKIVITGASVRDDTYAAYDHILTVVCREP